MKIKFLGAAQTVTGSRTLLQFRDKKILIDCGLFQGPKEVRNLNWDAFEGASDIHCMILTHAHIDHSGFIPRIVKDGFKGPIYCAHATFELCKIMLIDSAHLQEEDARYAAKKKYSHYKKPLPLYTQGDAEKSLNLFVPQNKERWIELFKGFSYRFVSSGHILGSCFVQISYDNGNGVKILTFSGDLGHNRQFVLRGPSDLNETDFLVMESTYGNRCHSRQDSTKELERVINKTYKKNGVLVIPSFAVGRTQEIVYIIKKLVKEKRVPDLPVYVDSPMANRVSSLYIAHKEELKLELSEGNVETTLSFDDYIPVGSVDSSMLLCMKDDEPMIIVSAAGMLSGGRILHHLKSRLPDAKNTVLFVGFQAEGTKGRLLQSGLLSIRIHHQEVDVEADIETISSLSAHGDSDDILKWIGDFSKKPKKIYLNHGEPESINALAYRIKHKFGIECVIPKRGESFNLE